MLPNKKNNFSLLNEVNDIKLFLKIIISTKNKK